MIVILCDSYDEACNCYDCFVSFLNQEDPWAIKRTYDFSQCVETDDDLRYLFVDKRYEGAFIKKDCDIIDEDEFFEGIENWFEYYGVELKENKMYGCC